MRSFAEVARDVVKIIDDPASTNEDLGKAAGELFRAAEGTSRDEANDVLALFANHLRVVSTPRVTFVGLISGAMVERGCDVERLAIPLAERLKSLFEAAGRLTDACEPIMQKGDDHDRQEEFEKAKAHVAPEMRDEVEAWDTLDQFWPATISIFSANPSARAAANAVREPAAKVSNDHEAGHWIALMLSVLVDEPILAIEPATNLGILGRISGVVDNFQLNVLLMDAFPPTGLLSRKRVPKKVAEVARGNGPQQTEDHVTGVWNLYTWQAIDGALKLPDPADYSSNKHWVWNEGRPEDIPSFEGRRVILLGPASYARGWRNQRMFADLPADLTIERQLTKKEVNDLLRQMAAAKDA